MNNGSSLDHLLLGKSKDKLPTRTGLVYGAIFIFAVYATCIVLLPGTDYSSTFRITRIFLIVFAAAWLIGLTRTGHWIENRIYKLSQRAGMVFGNDAETEAVRLNLIRIVVGVLFFLRAAWIGEHTLRVDLVTDWTSPEVMATLLMLVTAACMAFGILTPIFCLLSTAVLYWHMDAILGSQTLGTYVLLMIVMTFAFAPAGTILSVDAWLARRSAIWDRILRVVYAPFGKPTVKRSGILRFLGFLSYAIVCLYSSLFHIDDPAWIEGFANLQALTSTFLGRHHEFFQRFYDFSPEMAIWLSKITGWGMIVWEMFLIPLVLASRWTRILAIAWGLLFFLCSLFLFNLSFLPYYEFGFWALLFLPMARHNEADTVQVDVFFDDRCTLCDRTMRVLTFFDVFNVIAPRPASQNVERLASVGLSYDDAMKDLYGWDSIERRLYGGFDFYLLITKRVFLLTPLHLVLLAAKICKLGWPVYRWMADRRRRLWGICEISKVRTKPALETLMLMPPITRWTLFNGVAISHLVLLGAFITVLPHSPIDVTSLPKKVQKNISRMAQAALNYGMGQINVFNKNDLLMSTNYFVVQRIMPDGSRQLVPYHGFQGERLGMDGSDTFLYGVSAVWRRSMIAMDDPCYDDSDARQVNGLRRIIRYDQAIVEPDPTKYVLSYYRTTEWDYEILRGFAHQTFQTTEVCDVIVDAASSRVIKKTVTSQPRLN